MKTMIIIAASLLCSNVNAQTVTKTTTETKTMPQVMAGPPVVTRVVTTPVVATRVTTVTPVVATPVVVKLKQRIVNRPRLLLSLYGR